MLNVKNTKKAKKIIPVFFACDDNYAKYLAVAIKSMMANANKKDYSYHIYVLETDLDYNYLPIFESLLEGDSKIEFVNVKKQIKSFQSKLSLRDYYTCATYYRFFIMEMFPQYDKAVYLDSDIVVCGDISRFYNYQIGNNLLGAVQDEVLYINQPFAEYSELNVGVPTNKYFNAGILLMNLKQFRDQDIFNKFIRLVMVKSFPVAQDQDYLNYLCYGKVRLLPLAWNKNPFKTPLFNDKLVKIVHFKMAWKPWKYDGILYEEHFWKYAKMTPFYQEILDAKNSYTPEMAKIDEEHGKHLMDLVLRLNAEAKAKQRISEGNEDGELSRRIKYC